MKHTVDTKTFWISLGDIQKAGVIEPGSSLYTKDEIETFTSEGEWKAKVKELGIKDEDLLIPSSSKNPTPKMPDRPNGVNMNTPNRNR